MREQQNAPPRSPQELAMLRAHDALDDVVRLQGTWDSARPALAAALYEAGCQEEAEIASGGEGFAQG